MSKAVLAYEYIYGTPGDPSTREAVGTVCPVTETASLAAVERRERMVEILLRSAFLRLNPRPCGMHYTWPRLSGRRAPGIFRDMMRRALYQCDAIQDFEAQAVIDLGVPVSAYLYVRPAYEQSYKTAEQKPSLREVVIGPEKEQEEQEQEQEQEVIDPSTVEGQYHLHKVVVPNRARVLQARYMRSLSTDDLMGVFMLLLVATVSWEEARTIVRAQWEEEPVTGEGDPVTVHQNLQRESQLVALQESILRRGTCFLYCDVRGYGERAKHRRQMMDEAVDLYDGLLNAAHHLEPLLIGSLFDELAGRLGTPQEKLIDAVEDEVAQKLGVKGAFETHPFNQHRGIDPGYWPSPDDP